MTLHSALFAVLLSLALSRDAFTQAEGSRGTKESWPLGCPVSSRSVCEHVPGSSPASLSSWDRDSLFFFFNGSIIIPVSYSLCSRFTDGLLWELSPAGKTRP